jgi:thiol-disulfide isomerase/thioredoxin
VKSTKAFFFGLFVLAASASFAQPKLDIGDTAPALKVTDWVKGTPTKEFVKGQVYVVEFWATWCGPCKTSIPHLSEMAKKYGEKVNFIGVSIWESKPSDYKDKVPAFVKSMGDKMAYNIATEGPDAFMATNWMMASGENGIPSSFIVDGDGKIVWIGHPMGGLDKALAGVLEGSYDLEKAKQKRAADTARNAEQAAKADLPYLKELGKALKAKDYKKAVEISDAAIKENPSDEDAIGGRKLEYMVLGDLPGIGEYLIRLSELPAGRISGYLNMILWPVVENERPFTKSIKKEILKVSQKLASLSAEDPAAMDTAALGFYRAGNKKRALELQRIAVAKARSSKEVDDVLIADLESRLKMYGG